MTYVKPAIVVYGEKEVAEWAVPQADFTENCVLPDFVANHCTGGKCTNGGSKA